MSQYNDAEFATNGGQAFPCDHRPNWMHPGMTLRDYFAAKAMQVHLNAIGGAKWDSVEECAKTVAGMSYAMADAMLKARG